MKRFLSLLVVLGGGSAHADKAFDSGSGATWDCAKDDDITINTSSGTYTFKGACKDINVNGSAVKISIESVEDLTVNGSNNTVTVGATDDIDINGADNKITWGKAIKGKAPKISNRGSGNTVKTGAVAVPATTSPATPATGDTTLDCGARPAVAITTGGRNYKITGICDKVSISGGDNKVAIEASKNLAVTGSGNVVTVGKADKIAAMGSKNHVTYGGGLTLTRPKIAAMGKGNVLVAATATAAVGASPTIGASASPGTSAVDCSKGATHAISTNDGNYVITGKCTLITIDGNNNQLQIASAKAVAVNGNNNSVDVTAVDKLATSGNDNTVRWKKGVGRAKAKVANPGTNNTIVKSK